MYENLMEEAEFVKNRRMREVILEHQKNTDRPLVESWLVDRIKIEDQIARLINILARANRWDNVLIEMAVVNGKFTREAVKVHKIGNKKILV